ncbi:TPA: hypothetical protein JD337_004893 [Citrobacter freundii]|jgi:hypothetical protein|nr:hypothetical protein [Citrobacter freundii]
MDPKDQDTKASSESQPGQGGGSNPMMMGMGMMKKMMAQMGSGGEGPMAMMQKMMAQMGQGQAGGEGAPPMQNMMAMFMCNRKSIRTGPCSPLELLIPNRYGCSF